MERSAKILAILVLFCTVVVLSCIYVISRDMQNRVAVLQNHLIELHVTPKVTPEASPSATVSPTKAPVIRRTTPVVTAAPTQ